MPKSIIVDTNLLLLLVIDSLDEGRLISSSKRLNAFTVRDYKLLTEYIGQFKRVLITPYLLTEVSNLIDLTGSKYNEAYLLARTLFSGFDEIKVAVKNDLQLPAFITHGITDASLVELVKQHVVLTNDNKMLPLLFAANQNNVMPFEMLQAASK